METTSIAGFELPRIGLGTWALGGLDWGAVSDEVALATCLEAFEQGIRLVDTAPIYGHGHAEERVGRAVEAYGRRDQIFIATKAGLQWNSSGVFANCTAHRLRQELEDSLRRLRTDFIDLYQIHWPDTRTPIAETAALLAEFLESGKVRALGVSNFNVAQMEEFRAVAPLASNQPPYNLFEREIDAETLPWCAKNHVAVLTWSSLCRSLLGGGITSASKFAAGDIRSAEPKFQEPRFSQYRSAIDRLAELAAHYAKTLPELAVRWVLDRPGVSVALWGARRPQQLQAVSGALGWKLEADAMDAIERILAESIHDPIGPEYLTPKVRAD